MPAHVLPACRRRQDERTNAPILVGIVEGLLVAERVALLVRDERFELRTLAVVPGFF